MKKISLNLETLNVETFAVTAPQPQAGRGTVRAHEAEAPTMPVEYCFFSVFPTCGIYC